jgi:hypothetical protein
MECTARSKESDQCSHEKHRVFIRGLPQKNELTIVFPHDVTKEAHVRLCHWLSQLSGSLPATKERNPKDLNKGIATCHHRMNSS